MKIILLQELKGRGGEGDVIDVAQGFAVNYLLPRKVAIEATKGNLKQLEQRFKNIRVREEGRLGESNALAEALEGKVVTVFAKVGEEGRLFGSITTVMIAEAIADQLRIEIDRRKIETHGHIKEVGPHVINVAIYRELRAELTVNVVAEGHVAEEVPVTVVAEVEGIGADGEPFVEVVEETVEQADSDVALDEATDDSDGSEVE
ncbi:MAG: 50S ribosomal protein L9 [Coriobacteriia bacterium]